MHSHTFLENWRMCGEMTKKFSLSEYHARLNFILRPINQSENCPFPPPPPPTEAVNFALYRPHPFSYRTSPLPPSEGMNFAL